MSRPVRAESAPPSAFRIEQALSIAAGVRARLAADEDIAEDEALLRDTLDGETDAVDILRRLCRFVLESEAMAEAAKRRIADLSQREARFRARALAARGAAFGMLDALGMRSLPDPEFTASVRIGKRAVIITDDRDLPTRFVRVKREPDKGALAAALAAGEEVPGAELANGQPSLSLKRT